MEQKDIEELIAALNRYPEEVGKISDGKPKREAMGQFKTYYEKWYKQLIAFIQFAKNKSISENAKKLPALKRLFSTFNKYMGLLLVLMAGPLAWIVYLYTLENYEMLIYTIIVVDVIIIYFLVKKIQEESEYVIGELLRAKPDIKQVANMIEEQNKKAQLN